MEQRHIKSYHAKNSPPLVILYTDEVPEFDYKNVSYETMREWYSREARHVVDAMQSHLPGGLFDAIFGEMARIKASVFSVARSTDTKPEGE